MSSTRFWKRARDPPIEKISGPNSLSPPIPSSYNNAENEGTVVQTLTEVAEASEKSKEKGLEIGELHGSPIEEDHYAHGVKLAVITVCVALSVLLVALVRFDWIMLPFKSAYIDTCRTIQ